MRDYGELKNPTERLGINPTNGQFLKGHVPFNKGKKWSEYMKKRAMKRSMKGWENLRKYQPKTRPDNCGRCRKAVIAVMDDGRWVWLPYIGAAGEWINGCRENVRRCCALNMKTESAKRRKVNTDHKYRGVRFYYESDLKWTTKIKVDR